MRRVEQTELALDDPRVKPTPVRRRDRVKPGQLRLCGVCHGRGAPKGVWDHDHASRILFWTWVRDSEGTWRELPFRLPNLVCHACEGSGLNASAKRALELEIGCRREMTR